MVMFLAITACLALLSVDFASAFTQLEKGTFLIEDDYSEQHHDGKAKPDDKNIRKDHPWDHLVLTQQWPPTACLNSGHHKCVSRLPFTLSDVSEKHTAKCLLDIV